MPTRKVLTEYKNEWLFSGKDYPIKVKYVEQGAKPIKREGHYHRTRHEYFLVLEGEIEINIDGNDYKIEKMGIICVHPTEIHKIINIKPNTKYVCIGPLEVPNDNVELEKRIRSFG